MRIVRLKFLGISLIAITMVFILFFHGILRSQMIKMHIEEEMKETLKLEALQLEAVYNSIHDVTDQMILNQYDELVLENKTYVESVQNMLEGHRNIAGSEDVQKVQDEVLAILKRLNMNADQKLWVITGHGSVLCCPIQTPEGDEWISYPRLYEKINIQNDESQSFLGSYAYLTEQPEMVQGYSSYDAEWGWYIVAIASVEQIEADRRTLGEKSIQQMEEQIAQMSIEGTAAILTEDLLVKYYSYADMQGVPLMLRESQTQESLGDILETHKNEFVEYAILDPKTLKDRTRLAYVNYNADKKLYFVITRNREELFEDINLQSVWLTRLVGILTVVLFVINGYLILRRMRNERTEGF